MARKREKETREPAAEAPGAGSGTEDRAHERVVRGTAAGAEGYSPDFISRRAHGVGGFSG